MNFQLSLLVQLQRLDLKLHDLEEQRKQIPERLQAAEFSVEQAQKREKELQASLRTIAAERRSSEQDLNVHERHVHKMRERLNEVKTNREYQAHLFEIELANKKKDALEERVLTAMERAEEKQRELDGVQRRLQEVTHALEKERTAIESLSAKLAHDATQVDQQKNALVPSLEKRVYDRYSTLKLSLKLRVIAPVSGGTCQGCQLQIPPQLVASVKRADQLLTCPYCYRILYDEEIGKDVPESVRAQERVTSERLDQ